MAKRMIFRLELCNQHLSVIYLNDLLCSSPSLSCSICKWNNYKLCKVILMLLRVDVFKSQDSTFNEENIQYTLGYNINITSHPLSILPHPLHIPPPTPLHAILPPLYPPNSPIFYFHSTYIFFPSHLLPSLPLYVSPFIAHFLIYPESRFHIREKRCVGFVFLSLSEST